MEQQQNNKNYSQTKILQLERQQFKYGPCSLVIENQKGKQLNVQSGELILTENGIAYKIEEQNMSLFYSYQETISCGKQGLQLVVFVRNIEKCEEEYYDDDEEEEAEKCQEQQDNLFQNINQQLSQIQQFKLENCTQIQIQGDYDLYYQFNDISQLQDALKKFSFLFNNAIEGEKTDYINPLQALSQSNDIQDGENSMEEEDEDENKNVDKLDNENTDEVDDSIINK